MTWTRTYTSPPGWKTTRKRIFKRDNFTCYICGQDGADEIDHIINVAAGGTHDDDNLAAIHRDPCHKTKTAQEAHTMGRATRPPAPPPTTVTLTSSPTPLPESRGFVISRANSCCWVNGHSRTRPLRGTHSAMANQHSQQPERGNAHA